MILTCETTKISYFLSSFVRDWVLIVIGWNENIWKRLIVNAGRLIGRKSLDWSRRGVAALIPTFVVVDVIGHEEVQQLELPYAVLFDVFVFVSPFTLVQISS